jgi:hypothetical protein
VARLLIPGSVADTADALVAVDITNDLVRA